MRKLIASFLILAALPTVAATGKSGDDDLDFSDAPKAQPAPRATPVATSQADATTAASLADPSSLAAPAKPDSDAEFKKKLNEMLTRTEKSLKIIREQIIQNQSAPFLADLYLQLGDLLVEKSTVLYYLEMQYEHHTDNKITATQKYSPVVTASQEAIETYQQILKEFPKFDKRDMVLYRLAVTQKSIDESAAFVATAETLIKDYPKEKETIQAHLLLGQYFYDTKAYSDALEHLNIVKDSTYPYERNAARYRIGLIDIEQEKNPEALKMFEQVALDDELKEDLNPAELDLKTKASKTNLKREALIDSIRAYTEVYKKDADPVGYYSKISPTEALFQETIEKLSFRYIFLKRYDAAIKLLRVLSERIADPQKIMNIYQEVLVMIPVDQRLDVPVQEMGFVLDKYNDWSTHYNLSPQMKKVTYDFFEKQIRELGTRSHDLAKVATDPERKAHLYERARQYYDLYLGFFDKGPRAVKIAVNLADVYYNQRNFFQSGSYYLRVYSGEFGPPTQKVDLIQNAILSLQKPADYAYYQQLRAKGMMVKAIASYMTLDPKKRNDPSLNFAMAKAYFEQGYYDRAFRVLYSILKRFPTAHETADAADLILHYYNTRSDYKGLAHASEKMLAMHLPDSSLNAHLQDVHSKAQLRRLDEQVKTQKDYDVMNQGRSYLETALSINDSSLRSAALQQALGHSKEERDIDTFLKTATAMAKVEKDPAKRAEIWNSMADEVLAITRFYQAIGIYNHIASDRSLSAAVRNAAFDKTVRIASMLHDPARIASQMASPMTGALPAETKTAADQLLLGMLDSGVLLPENAQELVLKSVTDDKDLLSLFKDQQRLSAQERRQLMARINSRCGGGANLAICKWVKWPMMNEKIAAFNTEMSKIEPKMTSIDPAAAKLSGLLDATKAYEGSGEPQVDILVTLGNSQIYEAFATFLKRAASANKDFAQILNSKAQESAQASRTAHDQCGKILKAADLQSSKYNALCGEGRGLASVESTLDGPPKIRLKPPNQDPHDQDLIEQEKAIFAKRDDWKSYFALGETYLNHQQWFHAAATAIMARSAFPQSEEEFNAILGCALASSGQVAEARFTLAKASDMNGHKSACMSQINRAGAE